MLITFKCKHFHNIVMFGDVGMALLKAMGTGGNVPGIIRADEAAQARARLQETLAGKTGDTATDSSDGDNEEKERGNTVSLRQRAIPLLEMLEVADKDQSDIIWE